MTKNGEKRHLVAQDGSKKFTTILTDEGELINLHVEPLWRKRPDLWFQKIEAELYNCNVEDDYRKYGFIVSLLDEETSLEMQDIITPRSIDKDRKGMYDFLKQQLITRITAKNEEQARKRMMAEQMGDRKPSEFYSYLSSLTECNVRDKFVEEVWLECLPSKIRSVVQCLKDCELDTLTLVADRVHEVFFLPPKEQPINKLTPTSSALMESLVKEVETLNKKVQMLKRGSREQSTGREAEKETPAEKKTCDPKSKHQQQCNPCKYHTKYGVKLCKMRKNCQKTATTLNK